MIARRELLWRGAALLALTGSAAEAAPRPRLSPRPRVARPWPRLAGVNIAGLEFGEAALPGEIGKDYIAPSGAELAYFAGKGLKTVRIPFLWERAQPQPLGELDADYVGLLAQIVAAAQPLGMTVILDLHNYGRRRFVMSGQIRDGSDRVTGLPSTEGLAVGLAVEGEGISKGSEVWEVLDATSVSLSRRASASGPVTLQVICALGQSPRLGPAHFADVWKRLATRFADAPNVIFGLMNEPHDQDGAALAASYNAAIRAIRAAGADQLVLAAGEGWSSGKAWLDSGAAATLAQVGDPGGRLAFEVHQYLDWDGSGHYAVSRGAPRHQPGAGAGRL